MAAMMMMMMIFDQQWQQFETSQIPLCIFVVAEDSVENKYIYE